MTTIRIDNGGRGKAALRVLPAPAPDGDAQPAPAAEAGNGSGPASPAPAGNHRSPGNYPAADAGYRSDEQVLAAMVRQFRAFRARVRDGDGYTLVKLMALEDELRAQIDGAIIDLHDQDFSYAEIARPIDEARRAAGTGTFGKHAAMKRARLARQATS